MIAFGHTAVGVIVGVTSYKFLGHGNLATGLITTGAAGIVSHYIMDAIPHGHFRISNNYKKDIIPIIIFDVFLSIFLFLGEIYIKKGVSEIFLYTLFGIGGSQLPDIIEGLIEVKIIKSKGLLKMENDFHLSVHWKGNTSKPLLLGIRDIWQLLVVLLAFYLVIFI